MIYKNIEEVRRDFDYLTQKTSFDYLMSAKLDSSILDKYISNLTHFDDKFVLNFFKSLIQDLGLKVSNWKTQISAYKLPAIILIPNEGLKICLEITPDNFFKLESSSGIEAHPKMSNRKAKKTITNMTAQIIFRIGHSARPAKITAVRASISRLPFGFWNHSTVNPRTMTTINARK